MGEIDGLIKVLIIPVVLGFFKTEIANLITAWNVYRKREFDRDGDPDSPDKAQLLNGSTGQWGDITIEKYVFSLNSAERGVYVLYPDGGRERISLINWAKMRKRWPPEEKPEDKTDQ